MTDNDYNECYYDHNPVCFEQTRLILDLLKKLDNEKTTTNIYKKAFKNYEDYIKNEDWVFLKDGCYKVIKCDKKEYKLLKDKNVKTLINTGLCMKESVEE